MTTEDKTKPFADVFEQTAKNYEQILKSGMKVQQESAKWWTNAFAEAASPEIQKKVKAVADELIPQAQKSIDDWLKVVEENSRTGIDLLKKAVGVTQSASLQEAQTKVFGLWEASLNAMCETTQAVTQSNTKAMEAWLDFVRKTGEPAHATSPKQ